MQLVNVKNIFYQTNASSYLYFMSVSLSLAAMLAKNSFHELLVLHNFWLNYAYISTIWWNSLDEKYENIAQSTKWTGAQANLTVEYFNNYKKK